MDRRTFLKSAGAVSATLVFPKTTRLLALDAPPGWRTFDVTTRVEVLKPAGTTRVWLPAAMAQETPFQRTLGNDFHTEGGTVELVTSGPDKVGIVSATFPERTKPIVTLTCRASTKNHAVDVYAAGKSPKPNAEELQYCLRASKVIPVDGIVKAQATMITKDAKTDVEKARAIYDWIVVNTYRNPKTRGCGVGDVKFMLESQDLGGKCADLNALYVGLARASGLPSRHIYGLRVAKSQLGFKSLGPSSPDCTHGQHCRAEVWLKDYGWVPVDPADVRKVVLEEPPGNLPIDNEMVVKARKRLFGAWEMNWIAYNYGADVELPGSKGAPVNYFMYPQGETAEGRLDPFDAENFKYEIASKEVTSG